MPLRQRQKIQEVLRGVRFHCQSRNPIEFFVAYGFNPSAGVIPASGAPNSARAAKGPSRFRLRLYKNIDILGCARLGVDGYGVSAEDEVLNAVRVQNGQEL